MAERKGLTMRLLTGRRGLFAYVTMAVCIAALGVGLLSLAGCQESGQLVATQQVEACPVCRSELRTTSVEGVNYTRLICPECRTVKDHVWDGYYALHSEVYVCDQCEAVVGLCEACEAVH